MGSCISFVRRHREVEDPLITSSTSPMNPFFISYCSHQNCSLPKRLIFYIAKNPLSAKGYRNIIKTCKYFFLKNPIILIPRISLQYENNEWSALFNGIPADINNICGKMWAIYQLRIQNKQENVTEQNFTTFRISKIYRSCVIELNIFNQNIFYDDFIFLTPKCERITLNQVTVLNNDGGVVALENIVESLPQIKEFTCYFGGGAKNIVTSKTAKELIKISHFSNINEFFLNWIPATFDMHTFYDYLKKNKTTRFRLEFRSEISQNYRNHLQRIVDEIIETENHDFNVPWIYFPGIWVFSLEKLTTLFDCENSFL